MSELLDGLNDMQKEAVLHGNGPLLILAGAGSGKTRVLTHRIAYLIAERGVSPYSIIALTFTNKAAGEMKERVARLVGPGAESIWVSTFHSSCVRILRRFIDTIGYGRDFVIYDADDQKSVMKDVFRTLAVDPKKHKEKTVLGVISSAKDELIGPDDFEIQAGGDKSMRLYATCYKEYQKRLKANNALDFDDLIFKTIELFRMNGEALAYYRRRFEYILVDEYQDTNSAQFELIRLLAQHTNEYGEVERNLCVVGDDDQSIYKFRGANIRNILDFEKTYTDAKTIRLEENYRSTKNILDVANDVIANNVGRKEKRLWTQNDEGSVVELRCCRDDNEEAMGVVSDIASAVREGFYEYKDFAILYRTNAQSRSFEEKLVYRNIPYRIIGGQNFYQRKEIKDILAYLRTMAGGSDSVAVKRIINVPKRGIGAATIERLDAYAEENGCTFYDALARAPFIPGIERAVPKIDRFVSLIEGLKSKLAGAFRLRDIIDEILEATQYIDYLGEEDDEEKVQERIENINELITKITDYEDSYEESVEAPTLAGFLDEVTLVADIDSYEEGENRVLLMTLHSAKGLEFPNVYMVGMEEGIFPGYMSINADNPAEEIEEERRLCYVGITRAREHLTLTYCKQRMMRGELQFNGVSRFVHEIPKGMVKVTGSQLNTRLNRDDGMRRRYSAESGTFESPSRRGGYDSDFDGGSRRAGYSGGFSGGYESAYRGGAEYGSRAKTTPASPKKSMADLLGLVSKGMKGSGEKPSYDVGDRVRHVKFGEGTVTALEKGDSDWEVTVDFANGSRKMKASFAKLEKL